MATHAGGSLGRRRRSDGERTHAAILERATQIASVEGIDGLTLGRLADALGVSKSGVYAHFGSKQQLQLETVQAAGAVFEREVLIPARRSAAGLSRLEALCEAYLSYVERLVFPGGCFFAGLLAEVDARTGPIHDLVREGERQWSRTLQEAAAEAQHRGEIAGDTDLELLGFQLQGCLELGNYHFVLYREARVLERARLAVTGILGAVRTAPARGDSA